MTANNTTSGLDLARQGMPKPDQNEKVGGA